MKLLLDEMYPAEIAKQLRERGHDVEAVTARPELRGLPDSDIFALAQQEQRSVVTENIDDFSAIAGSYDQRSQSHYGIVFAHPNSYRRGNSRTIGRMVVALEQLLRELPETEITSPRHWL